MKDTSKIALGILAGAAAGAVVALLFSPDNGKNIRKSVLGALEDWGDVIKNKSGEYFSELKGRSSDFYNDLEDYKDKAVKEVKSKYKGSKNHV